MVDIETDSGVEYPQDDDLDDNLIPVDVPTASQVGATAGGAEGVLTFDQDSLQVFSAMNENITRMADSMGKLDSMTRLSEAFENLSKALSEEEVILRFFA